MAQGKKIWINCHKCRGDGLVLNVGLTGLDPTEDPGYTPLPGQPAPSQIVCPVCKGAKKFVWGWLENESQEIP